MIASIKNMILAFKTAFFMGKNIGQEGKQKDFIKNPIKTIRGVKSHGDGQIKDNQDRIKEA